MEEESQFLQDTLLLHLRQVRFNKKINSYLISDSELMLVLVIKLYQKYSELPNCISLLEDPN